MRHRFLLLVGASTTAFSLFAFACGHSSGSAGSTAGGLDAAGIDRARLSMPIVIDASTPDASCTVTIQTPDIQPGVHVAIGTDITSWDSNPPSSGEHYPIWAAFLEFPTPVPRGYYVHDLEHGAVVLLYNCAGDAGDVDGGACPDVVQGLRDVAAAIPDDPLCTSGGEGVRVRTVITPDPLLPAGVKVAATAWGWTYTSDCIDVKSLTDFAQAHYGMGTEMLCAQGQTTF